MNHNKSVLYLRLVGLADIQKYYIKEYWYLSEKRVLLYIPAQLLM